MKSEIEALLNNYLKWLKDRTVLREIDGDWVEITAPYLDHHNDYIQIYARNENGTILLTDDGYTIEDLSQSGCTLDSGRRQNLLKMTLNGFGVELLNDELQVQATPETFPLRKHSLIQAMLSVNDMFCLAEPRVASLFHEDVVNWLDGHEIRYSPRVIFKGKSGYDHVFDFLIPKSRRAPERVVKAINRPNRESALTFTFSWDETKGARAADSKAYALLNDSEHAISGNVIEALGAYGVHPIAWSEREDFREELAA